MNLSYRARNVPEKDAVRTKYVAFETDDIAAEVARIKEAGGTIVHDVWTNEHDGNTLCKTAVLVDPDGNGIMLHEIAAWRVDGEH